LVSIYLNCKEIRPDDLFIGWISFECKEKKMLVDHAKIYVKGGDGGNGMVS